MSTVRRRIALGCIGVRWADRVRTGLAALTVLTVLVGLTADAFAHELGVTQVTAEFRQDGTYTIDVTVDPDALLTRLEAFSRGEISSGLPPAERDRRIAALGRVFLERVEVRFDGGRQQSTFEYLPVASEAPAGSPGGVDQPARTPPPGGLPRVRLTGRQPAGAGTWTFRHGAAIGAFAMDLRVGAEPVRTIWLEGNRTSGPLPLATGQNLLVWAQRAAWMAIGLAALCWHSGRLVHGQGEGRDKIPA